MNPLTVIKHALMQLQGHSAMELSPIHTAVMLHAEEPPDDEPLALLDTTFIWPQIVQGEALHQRLDALLEEHAPADSCIEITVFWHLPDGRWHQQELRSCRGRYAST